MDDYLRILASAGIGYVYEGQVEENEERFLSAHLPKLQNPTVVDVGANVGNYAASVKRHNPSASLYCFEPQPQNFEKLSRRFEGSDVRVFPFGMSDKEEELTLYDWADENGTPFASLHRGVIEQLQHKRASASRIKVRALDAVAAELGIRKIDLLKIDTEGHELSVMKGAESLIRGQKVDVIQWEFNDMNVITRTFFKDFFEFLSDYLIVRLTPTTPIPIYSYAPILCEVFALQTYVAFRKDA